MHFVSTANVSDLCARARGVYFEEFTRFSGRRAEKIERSDGEYQVCNVKGLPLQSKI